MKKLLITGGAGFIGSHVVRLMVNKYADYQIFNLDALTYAGNLENLKDIEDKPNYTFVKGDITDAAFLNELFAQHHILPVDDYASELLDSLNALSPQMFVELRAHIDAIAEATDEVGCVILHGAGRSFSAGNDLKAIAAGRP